MHLNNCGRIQRLTLLRFLLMWMLYDNGAGSEASPSMEHLVQSISLNLFREWAKAAR